MRVIEHIKEYKWTGYEIGFFNAIGNYIAWGRVPISTRFDAVEGAT